MEQVYQYLTGMKFRQRVEAVIEKFEDMREDLDRERKFMGKQWSKREAQILAVVNSTVGMVGDLQGIAGKAMPEIPSLDMPLLEASTDPEARVSCLGRAPRVSATAAHRCSIMARGGSARRRWTPFQGSVGKSSARRAPLGAGPLPEREHRRCHLAKPLIKRWRSLGEFQPLFQP